MFVTVTRRSLPASLTPASRRQDHTTSPSARQRSRQKRRPRPPHPASNVRDDRETPLERRRDSEESAADLGVRSRTPIAADWHDGQISPQGELVRQSSLRSYACWPKVATASQPSCFSPCGRRWRGRSPRRMRGLHPRREPLTRLRFAKAPSPTRGEGKKNSAGE